MLGGMQGNLLPLLLAGAKEKMLKDYIDYGTGLAKPILPSTTAGNVGVPAPGGMPTMLKAPARPLSDFRAPVTVQNPNERGLGFPGIYQNPKTIAEGARANTAPESPNLKFLFNVTRRDLADMADRKLHPSEMFWTPKAKARGSDTSSRVMVPQNAQRLVDTLAEIKTGAPGMFTGMKGWYMMDPAYQRLVQLVGPERAAAEYKRLNAMAFYSPSSDVNKEINRGTAGGMFWKQGISDMYRDAGLRQEHMAAAGYPLVQGHPYHRTAMHGQQLEYLNTGKTSHMTDPKVPLYLQSSLPPHLGGQSWSPVPDAHFSRGLGMADVRPWQMNPKTGKWSPNGDHMKSAEYTPIAPWYYNNVAKPLGLEGVPAQAIQWGGMGHLTGVKTKAGAPKLELFADRIVEIAKQLGITKQSEILKFRDQVLMGEKHSALDTASPYA
jgi:hypothetical protein